MTFLMLKVQNPGEFKGNQGFFKSLFKGFRSNTGIETYIAEKLDDYTSHFLFYLEDQKITGTLRSGTQSSEPFSQYIRLFCHKNVAFLEFLNEKYTDEIIDHTKKEHHIDLARITLKNENFLSIIGSYESVITKQIDFIDDDDCSVSSNVYDSFFEEGLELKEVIEKYKVHVYFISMEIPDIGLISFRKNGKININSLKDVTVERTFKYISENIGSF